MSPREIDRDSHRRDRQHHLDDSEKKIILPLSAKAWNDDDDDEKLMQQQGLMIFVCCGAWRFRVGRELTTRKSNFREPLHKRMA